MAIIRPENIILWYRAMDKYREEMMTDRNESSASIRAVFFDSKKVPGLVPKVVNGFTVKTKSQIDLYTITSEPGNQFLTHFQARPDVPVKPVGTKSQANAEDLLEALQKVGVDLSLLEAGQIILGRSEIRSPDHFQISQTVLTLKQR